MRFWLMAVISLLSANVLCVKNASADIVHEEKSLYRDLYVEETDGQRCLKFRSRNDRESSQSCILLQQPDLLVSNYTRMAMVGLFAKPQPEKILVVGLGGGVLPRALRQMYPNADITSVEIDEAVVAVAERFFHFESDEKNRVITRDARVFIKRAGLRGEQYDYIILDAFTGDYIPGHLMTLEFFQELRKIMSPQAVLVANTFSRSELVNHELATYQAAFKRFFTVSQKGSGNRIILASNDRLPGRTELHRNMLALEPLLKPLGVNAKQQLGNINRKPRWKKSTKVLTDQYSPVNVLNGK